MKKKVVSLMLVLAMTVSMTACGNKNNAADDANAVEDTKPVQNQAAAKKQ
jgi:oligopeptide transport system substrate-binding protein